MTKILLCLLFKNSNMWISRFFDNIDSLMNNDFNRRNNIEYNMSIVYGSSNDGTEESLRQRTEKYKEVTTLTKIDIPDRFNVIEKLAVLRNSFLQLNNLKYYDYLLMVDTDIMFGNSSINRMIRDIQNPKLENIGIIAPMVFVEDYGLYRDTFFYDSLAYRINGLNFKHTNPYIPFPNYSSKNNKRIIEVDSVGSMYLMKSDILISNKDIRYDTYQITDLYGDKKYESEQVYFCQQARKSGFKIYVDLNIKVFHVNLENYGLRWH